MAEAWYWQLNLGTSPMKTAPRTEHLIVSHTSSRVAKIHSLGSWPPKKTDPRVYHGFPHQTIPAADQLQVGENGRVHFISACKQVMRFVCLGDDLVPPDTLGVKHGETWWNMVKPGPWEVGIHPFFFGVEKNRKIDGGSRVIPGRFSCWWGDPRLWLQLVL